MVFMLHVARLILASWKSQYDNIYIKKYAQHNFSSLRGKNLTFPPANTLLLLGMFWKGNKCSKIYFMYRFIELISLLI